MWYECETCVRDFGSQQAAYQHMDAVGHWRKRYECQVCDEEFYDEDDYDHHLWYFGHQTPQYECEACDLEFNTPQLARVHMGGYTNFPAARNHMDESNHWRTHWCQPCKQGFQNDNNLQQHLRGSAHLKNSISCPFCKRGFTVASGVAHHLEIGSCPRAPNLDRESIYRAINARDTSGVITNKLLSWDGAANAEYASTAATWNGYADECYLCHRDFTSLRGLNQHLASPIHKQKLYRCFGIRCAKQFAALAQLFNHLESESCGAVRFATVQKGASEILTGNRMIAF